MEEDIRRRGLVEIPHRFGEIIGIGCGARQSGLGGRVVRGYRGMPTIMYFRSADPESQCCIWLSRDLICDYGPKPLIDDGEENRTVSFCHFGCGGRGKNYYANAFRRPYDCLGLRDSSRRLLWASSNAVCIEKRSSSTRYPPLGITKGPR